MLKKLFLFVCILGILSMYNFLCADAKILNIANWSDYIDPEVLKDFKNKTGIQVNYDVFNDDEVLEAKLLSGHSGYDIVLPSALFLSRQIKTGIYQKLDHKKLTSFTSLDPKLRQLMDTFDPGLNYSVPYLWGTTGFGINVKKVKELLGDQVKLDSWSVIFEEKNIKKLSQCGVAFLSSPTDILPMTLKYLGLDPNSINKQDYQFAKEHLKSIRKYIRYFSSSKFISDLANGNICVAVGWSGDILQAKKRVIEAKKDIEIDYIIPKEGASVWFDMFAMPKKAKHVDEAYQFLNFILAPKNIARMTNYLSYANAYVEANQFVRPDILNDKEVYPSAEIKKNLYIFKELPIKINRQVNRIFTEVTTNQSDE